jgi:hypothetical protein
VSPHQLLESDLVAPGEESLEQLSIGPGRVRLRAGEAVE